MDSDLQTQTMKRVQDILAEALQVPPDEISPQLAFGDLPQWDSMGHMEVILRLEESYGIEVNADTIAGLTSVPAICSYLEEQGYVR